jgi:hypothetical protein
VLDRFPAPGRVAVQRYVCGFRRPRSDRGPMAPAVAPRTISAGASRPAPRTKSAPA